MKFSSLMLMLVVSMLWTSMGNTRTLRAGMKGEDVRQWQLFLIHSGLMKPPAYGNFSTRTQQATVAFQRKYRLSPSGVADSKTIKKAQQLGFKPFTSSYSPTDNSNTKGIKKYADPRRPRYYIELNSDHTFYVSPAYSNVGNQVTDGASGTYSIQGNTITFIWRGIADRGEISSRQIKLPRYSSLFMSEIFIRQ